MKADLPDNEGMQLLILENRRLRDLVVSLSATLLRVVSRQAAAETRMGGVSESRTGVRKAARIAAQRAVDARARSLAMEG